MTDNTQPLALMLADRLHHEQPTVLRIDAEHAGEELRRQHARIAELEAQLEAVGAGGVQALSAAPAVDIATVGEAQAFEAWYKQDCVIEGAAAKMAAKAAWKARASLAASPTPPAEQQAITPETGNSVSAQGAAITSESGAVYAELCCDEVSRAVDVVVERCISLTQDATGIKVVYDPIILANALHTELRGFADRTHALRMEQAAPKAAPSVEYATMKAQNDQFEHALAELVDLICPGLDTGNLLVDAKTAGDAALALHTKLAAPQQEAQKPCPTCAALARTVMLDQVSFDRKPDCYGIRQITNDEGVEEWEDIRTSPDVAREEANDMMATGRGEIYEVVPLWTTPQPSLTAKAADSVLEDAARLDWLALAGPTSICVVIDRPHDGEVEVSTDDVTGYGKTLREALDAARKQAAPKAAPGELHDHQILAITTAYEQGVGKGRQAHESGKEIANPYGTGYRCDLAWQYGYKEGKEQAERIAKASPTPPAEQQAQPVDQCVICGSDEPFTGTCGSGDPRALCQQAAPKAAPVLPEGWTACTIEFGNDGPEEVAYGPKRMMNRLAKWLGKYFAQVIADAAPKAAPGEPSDAEIDAFLDSPGGIEWVIADKRERYRLLVRAVLAKWAAPQQEAQEPALFVSAKQLADLVDPSHATGGSYLPARKTRAGLFTQPLYTAPQPAPAELERLRERISKMGLDVDRAMRGHVNEQSPLGTTRLAAIAALAKPAPAPLSRDQIREVFMAHGFTIKEGQSDLKQYVYDAAYALLGTKPAPLSDDVVKDAARWTTEQEHAIRQGHEIAASDGYFEARPWVEDNSARRKVFQAGFERGWDAARKQAAPKAAPAPLSEREAFEAAWEKLHGKRPVLWSRMFAEHKMETPSHSEGNYFARDEQAAWKLWQARAALAAQGGKV